MLRYSMIKVFYRPEMVAPSQGISPSPQKPALLAELWRKLFPTELDWAHSEWYPCSAYDLYEVHAPRYVDGVLSGRLANGFGTRDDKITRSLGYTTGSMKAAALWSFISGQPCVSPTSGFHHAGYSKGGGFCTFNGLMVAAMAVHRLSATAQIGILDADMHYGDGTDDIIRQFATTPQWLRHWSVGEHWFERMHAPSFMEEWFGMVETFLTFPRKLDVLIYQAGADPHVDDPLGGWLTTKELQRRDRVVFEQCRKYGVPVVWNLAGGYQEPIDRVLEIHCNTLRECLDVVQAGYVVRRSG